MELTFNITEEQIASIQAKVNAGGIESLVEAEKIAWDKIQAHMEIPIVGKWCIDGDTKLVFKVKAITVDGQNDVTVCIDTNGEEYAIGTCKNLGPVLQDLLNQEAP